MFDKVQNLLIISRPRSLSYRIQSIDLHIKSMDWFLYDKQLCRERVMCSCRYGYCKQTTIIRAPLELGLVVFLRVFQSRQLYMYFYWWRNELPLSRLFPFISTPQDASTFVNCFQVQGVEYDEENYYISLFLYDCYLTGIFLVM